MLFAILLVLIGLIWLLSNLGVISATISQVIWPLILIALGLYLLLKKKKSRYYHLGPWIWGWNEKEEKEGE